MIESTSFFSLAAARPGPPVRGLEAPFRPPVEGPAVAGPTDPVDDLRVSSPAGYRMSEQAPSPEHAPAPERAAPAAPPSSPEPPRATPEPPPVSLFMEQQDEAPCVRPSRGLDAPPEVPEPLACLLQDVALQQGRYGLSPQPPCPESSLRDLEGRVQEKFSKQLPGEYCALLQNADGLDHDGVVIYGSRTAPITGFTDRRIMGLVEANEYTEGVPDGCLVLGESSDSLYAWDAASERYVVLDSSSMEPCGTHESLAGLLKGALEANA